MGLVSELPQFAGLDFADWNSFVVGGHEIRDGSLVESLERLHRESRVFDAAADRRLPARAGRDRRPHPPRHACQLRPDDRRPGRPGDARFRRRIGPRRRSSGCKPTCATFSSEPRLDRVIVVNVASTEPADRRVRPARRLGRPCRKRLDDGAVCPLPASSLYAIAALDLGMPYINFTPSLGASPPAIGELAELRGTCHAGQDGKTGETLLKSVLAPMFAARNLEVMSWVGHNIFGNIDGQVLDDPANKAAKIKGKDQLVGNILGYDPQTLVSIEYIRSLGDWKTAWDHIHFRGFLGTPMTLQFTWQGCDSLLAAPLVLDLVRLRRAVASARRDRRAQPSWQLLQTPAGPRRTRFFPAIFATLRVGRSARQVDASSSLDA